MCIIVNTKIILLIQTYIFFFRFVLDSSQSEFVFVMMNGPNETAQLGRPIRVLSICARHTIQDHANYNRMDGWMICDFTSFSTVLQSYQDDGRMIMKGCVQWNTVYG